MISTEVTPAPISTAPPRICKRCHEKTLSYNNVSGMCTDCQGMPRSKANGHNGAQPHRELEHKVPNPARLNGAAPAHRNGKAKAAQPADDPSPLLVMPRGVESRLDTLIAAIPREDKAKLLSAWLAGTF